MANSKRARELARAKAQRQTQRREERDRKRRFRARLAAGITVVVVAGVGIWLALGPDNGTDTTAAEANPSEAPTQSAAATPGPVPTPENVTCTPPGAPRDETRTWKQPRNMDLGPGAEMVLSTNCGQIDIALDTAQAPKSTNALAFLSSEGFYTGNYCHRLTTAGLYVLQCGAPGQDGTGDVGFTVPDENLPGKGATNYPAGSVAMANRGPGTSSSQFFIVYKDTELPPNYSIVGDVTQGMDVVKYVAAGGVAPGSPESSDGTPAQALVIKSTKVKDQT